MKLNISSFSNKTGLIESSFLSSSPNQHDLIGKRQPTYIFPTLYLKRNLNANSMKLRLWKFFERGIKKIKTMGKILSVMSRPFRDFNVESRAHKIISKDKPTAAPKYKSDQQTCDQIIRENPGAFQESLQKNEGLDKHLKDIYVTSHDPMPEAPTSSSSAERPLPLDRTSVPESEFGYREPSKVPYGKVTLKNALRFIGQHQQKPIEYPISQIVEEHKLPEETVQNIIKHFRIYEVYIPTEKKVQAKFAGPLISRKLIFTHEKKELPAPTTGKGNDKNSTS